MTAGDKTPFDPHPAAPGRGRGGEGHLARAAPEPAGAAGGAGRQQGVAQRHHRKQPEPARGLPPPRGRGTAPGGLQPQVGPQCMKGGLAGPAPRVGLAAGLERPLARGTEASLVAVGAWQVVHAHPPARDRPLDPSYRDGGPLL